MLSSGGDALTPLRSERQDGLRIGRRRVCRCRCRSCRRRRAHQLIFECDQHMKTLTGLQSTAFAARSLSSRWRGQGGHASLRSSPSRLGKLGCLVCRVSNALRLSVFVVHVCGILLIGSCGLSHLVDRCGGLAAVAAWPSLPPSLRGRHHTNRLCLLSPSSCASMMMRLTVFLVASTSSVS